MIKRRRLLLNALIRWFVLFLLASVFIYFMMHETPIVFTSIVAVLFLLLFLAPLLQSKLLDLKSWWQKRQIDTAFKNGGGICLGEIKSVESTGPHWFNNTVYVRFSVIYAYEQEKFVGELKGITNLMVIPDVGHRIHVVYDPKKDKLYLADE